MDIGEKLKILQERTTSRLAAFFDPEGTLKRRREADDKKIAALLAQQDRLEKAEIRDQLERIHGKIVIVPNSGSNRERAAEAAKGIDQHLSVDLGFIAISGLFSIDDSDEKAGHAAEARAQLEQSIRVCRTVLAAEISVLNPPTRQVYQGHPIQPEKLSLSSLRRVHNYASFFGRQQKVNIPEHFACVVVVNPDDLPEVNLSPNVWLPQLFAGFSADEEAIWRPMTPTATE